MAILPTNYVDDVIDTAINEHRTYNIVDNQGNVIYEGVRLDETTRFITEGTAYGSTDVNATNRQINTNTDSIATLNTNINRISALKGKILCIGDSFSVGYMGTNDRGWAYYMAQKLGKSYGVQGSSNLTKKDCILYGYGGSGFSHKKENKNFATLLDTANADLSSIKDDITAIVVIGDGNDVNESDANVSSAINTFMTKAKTNFPSATVFYGHGSEIFDFHNTNDWGAVTVHKKKRLNQNIIDTLSTVAHKVIYLGDVLNCIASNKAVYLSNDGTHPNDVGYKMLGFSVASALLGTEIKGNTKLLQIDTSNFYNWVSDNVYHLELVNPYSKSGTFGENSTSWNGTPMLNEIVLNNNYLANFSTGNFTFQANGFIQIGNSYHQCTFVCKFVSVGDKKTIELYPNTVNAERNNYVTGQVKYYYIYPFSYTCGLDVI